MSAEAALGDSHCFNAHGDVLSATPEGPEEVARLVEELKSRGNAAFKARQLPVAETLYSKAIEHDPSNAVPTPTRPSMAPRSIEKLPSPNADFEFCFAAALWQSLHDASQNVAI